MNNGKICVSVCAETANEFLEKVERAAKLADIIELRLDCLGKNEFDPYDLKNTPKILTDIYQKKIIAPFNLKKISKPFIFTFRPREQGGKRDLSLEERELFWNSGFDAEGADFEEDVIENAGYWLYDPIICSHHDFNGVPENLNEIYDRLKNNITDVIKIAVQAHDATDGLVLMKLLEKAKAENKDLIPIAMGEAGVWTRVLGLARGAWMTFASLDAGDATAPGQLTAREMIDVYRVKELNRETEIYGLIGESVRHSVSPAMHNAAFKTHGLNAVYVPFAVKNLSEFMRRMVNPRTREIDWNARGFAVTIPHKIEIMQFLDSTDETARAIGAVNTIKICGDELRGFNTDADGFVQPLKTAYGKLSGARVAILGAGGAARACVYALKKENADVTVFSRDAKKAEKLSNDFGVEIRETDFASRAARFTDFNIVVNATPLGMKKSDLEHETPAVAAQIAGVGLIYDLIYNPSETLLMREANKVFVPTIGGLAMLTAQGAAQQKIWTGHDVPLKEMSAAALRKLQNQ